MDKDCFNILRHPAEVCRSGDMEKGLSLLSDIVNTLADKERAMTKDIFWTETAVLWLNGTGAIMMDAYPQIEQVNVVNWGDYNTIDGADSVQKLLAYMPENTAKAALKQCLSSAENTFRSILITASSLLAPFGQNPRLAAMVSHSSFTLEDLLKPKTALYLVTDDTTSTADPILGIILRQIQSFLINKAYLRNGGKLQTRMNFILDEFASIPIPDMDKALATHRSRNIRYYLCIQSMALLRQRYANPEALLANCESILYMGSTELSLLSELEAKLGRTRITPDGSEKPLCSQAELMTLEKAWNYKEAIYMNLSENIRFCTMLPSIEAYAIGGRPAAKRCTTPTDVLRYSAADYALDVERRAAHIPFASTGDRKRISGRYPEPEMTYTDEADYLSWSRRRRRPSSFFTDSGNKH